MSLLGIVNSGVAACYFHGVMGCSRSLGHVHSSVCCGGCLGSTGLLSYMSSPGLYTSVAATATEKFRAGDRLSDMSTPYL